jgi:hypothetical protein
MISCNTKAKYYAKKKEKSKNREKIVCIVKRSKVRDLENLLERKREKLRERETSFFFLEFKLLATIDNMHDRDKISPNIQC